MKDSIATYAIDHVVCGGAIAPRKDHAITKRSAPHLKLPDLMRL